METELEKQIWKVYEIDNAWEFVKKFNSESKIENKECTFDGKWNEFFKTKSESVKYYQTLYKIEDENDATNTFTLKLRVSKLKKGDFYVWDLVTDQFCRNVIGSDDPFQVIHPFERIDKSDIELCTIDEKIFLHIGGINAKNDIMDCLFKMLMSDTDLMTESSGNLHPEGYRSRLVKILHDLWD